MYLTIWGFLKYDNYQKKYYGNVNIPVGLENDEVQKIENYFELKIKNDWLLSKNNISTQNYFEILNNHKKITEVIKTIENKQHLEYNFSMNINPKFSKKLELENDWENLIKLKDYSEIIYEITGNNSNTTTKRIEKAEKQMLKK